jgi:2-polyprenyl-3-methyl-5-hydroxy-6-metoxy-1,4-benzoquinol methylase
MLKKLNKSLIDFFDRTFYPKFKKNWDNTIFREYALKYLTKDSVYLDAGAGRGALPHMNFKDIVKHAAGVDPSDAILENPYLHEAQIGFVNDMPFFENEKFDVICSNNVLEHVAEPQGFFSELNRVMKPGGIFIGKTPNFYHYVPIIAHFTPLSFHKFIMGLRGTPSEDLFPTTYLVNTKKAQKKLAKDNGFEIIEMKYIEARPEYLRMFFFTYIFGIIYERLVNLLGIDQLKVVTFTVFRKK